MMDQSISKDCRGHEEMAHCAHTGTESVLGMFGVLTKCDLCKSRIWNVLNVVKCIDCGRFVHGTCAFTNLLTLLAQDSKTPTTVGKRPEDGTVGTTKESRLASRFAGARGSMAKTLGKIALGSMAPEARRAVEREVRARKAIERRDAFATGKDEKRRTCCRPEGDAKATDDVTEMSTKNATEDVTTCCRPEEDAKATDDVTKMSTKMSTKYATEDVTTTRVTDDKPSWRDRPAPEIDYFVVSKWVRETFCGGRPAPPVAPAKTGRRTRGPFRRRRRVYRAWAAPQTTRVVDTSTPPSAVPAPPGPGPHWWGLQSFGPFVGPLMWHPVHAGPRSFEMPERDTAPTAATGAGAKPFSFDVPGYLDGVLRPALFKVTVTP